MIAILSAATLAAAADLRLVEAVKDRNNEAVRALLKQRVDVNAPQPDGATALHWAAHWDDLATADLLIRAGANVNAANDLGVTPLALACYSGNASMVERLLAAGANPNAAPIGEPVLMTAARTGSLQAVKALLVRGANVNATDAVHGQTALMWAVAHQHAAIVQTLVETGADIHARSNVSRILVSKQNRYGGVTTSAAPERAVGEAEEGGSTALLFAARQGDIASARILLAAGANANDTAADGTSALVLAAHSGQGAFAAWLLDNGADPNAAGAGYTALHAAVLRADLELLNALLAHAANPNARLTKGTAVRRYSKDFAFNESWLGATPFWLAARFGELELMRALVSHGADPMAAIQDGTTPLLGTLAAGIESGPSASDRRERRLDPTELAALAQDANAPDGGQNERTALEAVRILVDRGADVNAANRTGDTPLHSAAGKGFNTVVRFLVEKGAALDAKNKRGQTPLSAAVARLRADGVVDRGTAELLRQLGAK
jgi:ankyrin repeat protein